MVVPLLIVVVGQQIFRIAATAAARKAITAVGGRVIPAIPKALSKKRVGSESAFTKLVKEKKPALQDKIGNLFAKKADRVKQSSPGRTNKKEGINVGIVRKAASKRGDKVVGVAGAGAVSAPALAKLYLDRKKARTQREKDKVQNAINSAERALNNPPKGDTVTKPLRPKVRPRNPVRKSLRPKARPKKK